MNFKLTALFGRREQSQCADFNEVNCFVINNVYTKAPLMYLCFRLSNGFWIPLSCVHSPEIDTRQKRFIERDKPVLYYVSHKRNQTTVGIMALYND